MLLTQILIYISVIIWLFPPIRQYRTKLFPFFLVLALMDPITLGYFELFNKTIPFGFYLITTYLLFLLILGIESIKKNYFILGIVGFVFLGIIIFAEFTTTQSIIILLAFQFLIISITLKKFIVIFSFERRIDLFYLVLSFYFLTNITKFFNLLTGFADATAFFIITTIAQIIFGFYFSIVRENNS